MKNKILASLTALCAALVLVGGFSVTAYAQTPTEETDDSGVIVETEPQPLTPEGNMTLVDDIDGDAADETVSVDLGGRRIIKKAILPVRNAAERRRTVWRQRSCCACCTRRSA